ncbi:hypothetical protein [Tuwongella immobilis]|uniref:Uncharacterized protein n=1 Tax=Tuwongella immobilis TaxID=692036 RepID=A0A6C2YHV3_9BACT|nr:hypothetical protein [Tuwongella immobilis]VIP00841.1 unnamed protein product [Tuwongella immobilis]VTR97100.1 unnamed protein product [Tuwongella immobilis]
MTHAWMRPWRRLTIWSLSLALGTVTMTGCSSSKQHKQTPIAPPLANRSTLGTSPNAIGTGGSSTLAKASSKSPAPGFASTKMLEGQAMGQDRFAKSPSASLDPVPGMNSSMSSSSANSAPLGVTATGGFAPMPNATSANANSGLVIPSANASTLGSAPTPRDAAAALTPSNTMNNPAASLASNATKSPGGVVATPAVRTGPPLDPTPIGTEIPKNIIQPIGASSANVGASAPPPPAPPPSPIGNPPMVNFDSSLQLPPLDPASPTAPNRPSSSTVNAAPSPPGLVMPSLPPLSQPSNPVLTLPDDPTPGGPSPTNASRNALPPPLMPTNLPPPLK